MDQATKNQAKKIIRDCVLRTINRMEGKITHKPFHEALLTAEIVKASSFERSFSTSFGQGPVESISQIVIEGTGAKCIRQKESTIDFYKGSEDEINRILASLREGQTKPNWQREISRITAIKRGDIVVKRVISDIWFERAGIENYISLKTVMPNLDQTEIAKKEMLFLKAHNPEYKTFFALFYNPGGENRIDYNWSIPFKLLDMHNDECVLIGREYWDYIGGPGTYTELLELFAEIGEETREALIKI